MALARRTILTDMQTHGQTDHTGLAPVAVAGVAENKRDG